VKIWKLVAVVVSGSDLKRTILVEGRGMAARFLPRTSEQGLTSILVSKIQGSPFVGPAGDVAHIEESRGAGRQRRKY
jgi:hypothetical protein